MKAARASLGVLDKGASGQQFIYNLGIGFHSMVNTVERSIKEFGDDPYTLALDMFLTGVLSERFFQSVSANPEKVDSVVTLATMDEQDTDEVVRDFLNDIADFLFDSCGTEVPENATGTEIITLLRDKLTEMEEAEGTK